MPLKQLIKKTTSNSVKPSVENKSLEISDIEKKIQGIILGLFGSVMGSFGTALGVSVLTSDYLTIVSAGLIVGLASSFANSFGPLVAKSKSQIYGKEDLWEGTASFLFTFVVITLPLLSYLLMDNIKIARTISIMTGLVLIFIFAIQQSLVEKDKKSPLSYASGIVFVGIVFSLACYLGAIYLSNRF